MSEKLKLQAFDGRLDDIAICPLVDDAEHEDKYGMIWVNW
jgi:hypothetical protein